MLGRVLARATRLADRHIHARFVAVVMLFALLVPSIAAGQARKQRRPKVGDRVEVSFMGRMEPATITGFTPTGWPYVSIDRQAAQGRPPMALPLNQMRFLPEPPKERIWKDASGSFQIKATLTAKNASSVTLKKADGELVTVPIDKLSRQDKTYVKQQQLPVVRPQTEPNPPGHPSPGAMSGRAGRDIWSGVGSPRPGFGQPADTSEYDSLPVGNVSAMTTIALTDPSAEWSYTPLPTPAFAPTSLTPVDLPSGRMPAANLGKNTLVVSHDGAVAAVAMGDSFGKRTALHIVDFAGSRLLASHELPSLEFLPKDVVSKGPYVVTASTGTTRPEHVAFWKPSNGSLERVGGWRIPGKSTAAILRDVRFVGLPRVVTVDGSGDLVIWNVRDGNAIAGCRVAAGVGRAFNYDGRRMAAFADGAIHLFDLDEGRDLAAIAVSNPPAKLGLSPNGAKLAGLTDEKLFVWDLTTGKLAHQITLQGDNKPLYVDWGR